MNIFLALALMLLQISSVLGFPITTTDEDGTLATIGTDMTNVGSAATDEIEKVKSKCSTGCGVGIGIGCLALVLLFAFLFVMARRHKRRLHTILQFKRWQSKQKDLPDKPIPVPPPPSKF